jgi:putative hydrolase of the HAD superfamily
VTAQAMTAHSYTDTILANCKLLIPQPTDAKPDLQRLTCIRAILFDVYGTLLISASGDIGANSGDHRQNAIEQTFDLFRLKLCCSAETAIARLRDEIAISHAASRTKGIEYPEVDIVEIWQALLPKVVEHFEHEVNYQRLALEYEVRVNPVWPMPGLESTLEELANQELAMGIVSNAQFFTPQLFPALMDKTTNKLGFLPELSYFSYEYKQAKPGNYLYGMAREKLVSMGIAANEVLYVGNDMLNDITAAASVGFRTALFAGDRRSLRQRADDKRVAGVSPDVTVTELSQLLECVSS